MRDLLFRCVKMPREQGLDLDFNQRHYNIETVVVSTWQPSACIDWGQY